MAVAASGVHSFGKGESALVARKPLMVRPSPPRFLNQGDQAEVPIVLQNLSSAPLVTRVGARFSNAEVTGPRGFEILMPAMERVEIRVPVRTKNPGSMRMQVVAAGGPHTDGVDVSWPVWSPATAEAFATHGTIDEGAIVQRIQRPSQVAEAFGGLMVTTSATALAELSDAFLYLVDYPYDCSEQIASRLLGIFALEPVLSELKAPGLPEERTLSQAKERDFAALAKRQNTDGGWHYWADASDPYVTIHVAHAVVRGEQAGVELAKRLKQQALVYLQNIGPHIAEHEARWGYRHSKASRAALLAYAAYVRTLAGEDVRAEVQSWLDGPVGELGLDTLGWTLSVLGSGDNAQRAEVLRFLLNRVEETAAGAHFVTRYDQQATQWLLQSDRRTDAVILEGLIRSDPENALLPKLVRGLLDLRLKGRWSNTQENVFALLALERYFSTYERVTPDFVAQVWLGSGYAGEQSFRGRSVDRQHLEIPMSHLAAGPQIQELLMAKEGPGRLYYRIGLTYAPKGYMLEGLDRGFGIERTYEPVDRPENVTRREDGSWRVQAGALVRVRLKMVTTGLRFHVALVDRLPGGLEALNPSLGRMPNSETTRGRRWAMYWFEHQSLRDERVEAFATQVWPGVYEYSYVARATTPGSFVVPPARAEEMYAPETFGRTKSDRVEVAFD